MDELTTAVFALYLKNIPGGVQKKEKQAKQTQAENINGRTKATVSDI